MCSTTPGQMLLLRHQGPTAEENGPERLPRCSPQGASFAESVSLKEYRPCVWKRTEVPCVSLPWGYCIQIKWKAANVSNALTPPNSRLGAKKQTSPERKLGSTPAGASTERGSPSPPHELCLLLRWRPEGPRTASPNKPTGPLLALASRGARFEACVLLDPATSSPISELFQRPREWPGSERS